MVIVSSYWIKIMKYLLISVFLSLTFSTISASSSEVKSLLICDVDNIKECEDYTRILY
jgi:hypothetical protein